MSSSRCARRRGGGKRTNADRLLDEVGHVALELNLEPVEPRLSLFPGGFEPFAVDLLLVALDALEPAEGERVLFVSGLEGAQMLAIGVERVLIQLGVERGLFDGAEGEGEGGAGK